MLGKFYLCFMLHDTDGTASKDDCLSSSRSWDIRPCYSPLGSPLLAIDVEWDRQQRSSFDVEQKGGVQGRQDINNPRCCSHNGDYVTMLPCKQYERAGRHGNCECLDQ